MKSRNIIKILVFILVITICYGGFLSLLSNEKALGVNAIAEDIGETSNGVLNYSDGSLYEGEILYGRIRNGTGSYTWSTGEAYNGTWENDVPSGKGLLEWPGLGVYEGDFLNGKRHGTGTFTWTYEGEIPEGAPVSFYGEWVDDKIGTHGTLVLYGIGIYEGGFERQQRSGQGTFKWKNGDAYSGNWARDMIEGQGILTLSDGTILEGTFGRNVLSKGTITYSIPSGTVIRSVQYGKAQPTLEIKYKDGTKVSGQARGEEFIGNVTIEYASGDMYVGTVKNGVKEGKGTYTWRSGAHYTGEWVNDKMSGKGKYCYTKDENVLTLTGTFFNGVPDGTLEYVAETRLKYETNWSGGKCNKITYKRW